MNICLPRKTWTETRSHSKRNTLTCTYRRKQKHLLTHMYGHVNIHTHLEHIHHATYDDAHLYKPMPYIDAYIDVMLPSFIISHACRLRQAPYDKRRTKPLRKPTAQGWRRAHQWRAGAGLGGTPVLAATRRRAIGCRCHVVARRPPAPRAAFVALREKSAAFRGKSHSQPRH